tara:strand:- start:318 stop:452 length:135 start_codon:yes stop_codon:yes gene_type:complete
MASKNKLYDQAMTELALGLNEARKELKLAKDTAASVDIQYENLS